MAMSPWQLHVENWKDCTNCPLCSQRSQVVLARGQVPCDVLLVGEAPGESENVLGRPFVGPAGQVLDQIVERALMNAGGVLKPSDVRVAMTNLVACFPAEAKKTADHRPDGEYIEACRDRLLEFMHLCRPRLVVAVGALAEDWMPPRELMPDTVRATAAIVHPASILRMPLAQQGMACQRAVVVLANAVEDIMVPF